jgi:hypothetical protein
MAGRLSLYWAIRITNDLDSTREWLLPSLHRTPGLILWRWNCSRALLRREATLSTQTRSPLLGELADKRETPPHLN